MVASSVYQLPEGGPPPKIFNPALELGLDCGGAGDRAVVEFIAY